LYLSVIQTYIISTL